MQGVAVDRAKNADVLAELRQRHASFASATAGCSTLDMRMLMRMEKNDTSEVCEDHSSDHGCYHGASWCHPLPVHAQSPRSPVAALAFVFAGIINLVLGECGWQVLCGHFGQRWKLKKHGAEKAQTDD